MRMITKPQLTIIHTLLSQLGKMEYKPELVSSFTGGRTDSCREMYLQEAKELIGYLKGSQERQTVVKRIWFMAYEMNIITPGNREEKAMNAAKLDAFCKQRGTVKKTIDLQTLPELKRTAKQFEAMYKKHKEKQEALRDIQELEGYLQIFIKHEEYEQAAQTKKLIDEIKNEVAPKRKRAVKAV